MKFEFDEKILQVIDHALQELPFKVSYPVLQEINRQIAAQKAELTPSMEMLDAR